MSASCLQAYEAIVAEYIRGYRPYSRKEVAHFQRMHSLAEAVSEAASCNLPNGKRHPHQYRIPAASLDQAKDILLHLPLSDSESFDSLHEIIKSAIAPVHRIGELTIYDIAHRIGIFLRKEPDSVYLHRGTAEGARALGMLSKNGKLSVSALPAPFRNLTAHEIEDCLCIFKSKLWAIRNV